MKKTIVSILYLLFGFSICIAQIRQDPFPTYNTSIYGCAINSLCLTNYKVDVEDVSFKFKAQHTGSISAIRVYIMTGVVGYGAGNYGTFLVTLRHDSTSNHTPAQTYMTSMTHNCINDAGLGTGFPLLTFNSSVHVDSGSIYHVVFHNIDPDPANNYSSVNTLALYPNPCLTPIEQPFAPDVDWNSLYSTSPFKTWYMHPGNYQRTPIMEYFYTDGYSTGLGYSEVFVGTPKTISGNSKVMENITVSKSNRITTGVSIWMRRNSGTDGVTITLETSSGTLIESKTISAASVSTNYSWNTITWSSNHTLTSGQSYHLVLSAASGSNYDTYAIWKAAGYFTSNVYFADGSAKYTTNNSTWNDWGSGYVANSDLLFYFNSTNYTGASTPLPVQLTSFNGAVQGNTVALDWNTATEVNSYMFEIERRTSTQWESIGKIPAGGTSNAPLEYTYADSLKNVGSGNIFYRLKLINNDGSFQYSGEAEVLVTTAVTTTALPNIYALSQNYPNPFNPTTTINYQLQKAGSVSLKVYDMLGREVASLVDGNKGPGFYSAVFDASRLSSGTYIYRLKTDSFTEVKKLVLLK
jgi:hypothetical protein